MEEEGLKEADDYVEYDPSEQVVVVDYARMVADLTGTEPDRWEEVDGPDTRCGVDFHFVIDDETLSAQVNVDQGEVSIAVTDDAGDETHSGSLDLNESRTWSEMPEADPFNDDAADDEDDDDDDRD